MNNDPGFPGWLNQALAENKSAFGATRIEDDWPKSPAVGELRVACPMGLDSHRPRLVLIVDVSYDEGFVSSVLVSSDIDAATDWDIKLEAAETGLPYSILIESDVAGPLWFAQLGPRLGAISQEMIPGVCRAAAGDATELPEGKRGLSVTSPRDWRWSWKRQEVSELLSLSSNCASSLVEPGGDYPQLIDLGLFDPATTTEECVLRLVDRKSYLQPPPAEILQILSTGGILDVEKWRQTPGLDAWNAIAPLIARGISSQGLVHHRVAKQYWHPERSTPGTATDALSQVVLDRVIEGQRSLHVLTGSFLWKMAPEPKTIAVLAMDLPGFGRTQIVSHLLDREE